MDQIFTALREAGGGAGAFFLVDGESLSLEFANRPVRLQELSPEVRSAALMQGLAGPFKLSGLPRVHADGWQAAAPWGSFFLPVFIGGQFPWVAAIVLAESVFSPPPGFDQRLQEWAGYAYTRRLLHSRVRSEDQRRADLSGFLHHDLLQRSLFLKQRLLDSGADLEDEIALLEESLDLIQQEVEKQRPVLINQGVFFALQKLAAEARNRGIDLQWQSDFKPHEHPLTGDETAAGIYFIAAALIREAERSAAAGPIKLSLEHPTLPGRTLQLSLSHAAQPAVGFSQGLADVFERAEMIGAHSEVQQSTGGRIHYRFEV